jgi:hypothetical protein
MAAVVGRAGLRFPECSPEVKERFLEALRLETVNLEIKDAAPLLDSADRLRRLDKRELLLLPGMKLSQHSIMMDALVAVGLEPPAPPSKYADWRRELPLNILKLFPANLQTLSRLGITTIGELLDCGTEKLYGSAAFGPQSLENLAYELDWLGLKEPAQSSTR